MNDQDITINVDASVIPTIRLASIGILTHFQKQFPELKNILIKSKHPLSDWIFFMTSAVLVMSVILMKHQNIEELIAEARKINKDMPNAINNFLTFHNKNISKNNTYNDVFTELGIWVLLSMSKETPSHTDYLNLATNIGKYLNIIMKDFITKQ